MLEIHHSFQTEIADFVKGKISKTKSDCSETLELNIVQMIGGTIFFKRRQIILIFDATYH